MIGSRARWLQGLKRAPRQARSSRTSRLVVRVQRTGRVAQLVQFGRMLDQRFHVGFVCQETQGIRTPKQCSVLLPPASGDASAPCPSPQRATKDATSSTTKVLSGLVIFFRKRRGPTRSVHVCARFFFFLAHGFSPTRRSNLGDPNEQASKHRAVASRDRERGGRTKKWIGLATIDLPQSSLNSSHSSFRQDARTTS